MSAVQIHFKRVETPEIEGPAPTGWKVAGPLQPWRADDEESRPRCSINGEAIGDGERYAIAVRRTVDEPFRIACLSCARLAPPPTPEPRESTSKPTGRRWGEPAVPKRPRRARTPREPKRRPDRDYRITCPGRWCPCFGCSLQRAENGQPPLDIVIGNHVLKVPAETGGAP